MQNFGFSTLVEAQTHIQNGTLDLIILQNVQSKYSEKCEIVVKIGKSFFYL